MLETEGLPEDSKEQYQKVDLEIWYIEVDLENIVDI